MKHHYPLLLLPLLLPATLAVAQSSGVHVAPGKPLHLQRPATTAKPAPPAAPTIVLPRYWTAPDSAQRLAGQEQVQRMLWRYQGTRATVWRSAAELGFQSVFLRLHLTINADGTIRATSVTRQDVVVDEPVNGPSAAQLFIDEANRALQRVRFTPAPAATDTVSIVVTYRLY